MQSNFTNETITITLSNLLTEALNHKELRSIDPFRFFPVCGGDNYDKLLTDGDYWLGIEGNNRFIARTDYANYPNYGAVWLVSPDRLTLTYSHTEDDF